MMSPVTTPTAGTAAGPMSSDHLRCNHHPARIHDYDQPHNQLWGILNWLLSNLAIINDPSVIYHAGRQIDTTYVETGKVRFGYFNFAFLGDESQWAAEAAECAGDQDAYWEFHDYLFSHQNGENQGAFIWVSETSLDMGLIWLE
jgi:hypothetical protein